jgi:hypothetical protein
MVRMSVTPTLIAIALAAAALVPAAAHAATAPPHLVGGKLTAKRITTPQGTFVSFGAVVRLDRGVTTRERSHIGLITAPWNHREQVADGAALPDNLFGGTSLGRIGSPGRHCYVAEVAEVRNHTKIRYGSTWRLAVHDGKEALGTGLRLHARDASSTTEREQAEALRCYLR